MVLLVGGQVLRSFSLKPRPGDSEGHCEGIAPGRMLLYQPSGLGNQEGRGDASPWWELCQEAECFLVSGEFYRDPFMEVFVVVPDI